MKLNQVIALFAALAVPQLVLADDKPVKFEDLPPAVAKAIQEASGGEKPTRIELDDDGKSGYEAEWKVNGREHEINVAADGKVLSREEAIPLEAAPEPVRAAITAAAEGGKVLKVKKETDDGRTEYKAKIESAKGPVKLKLDETGKKLTDDDD